MARDRQPKDLSEDNLFKVLRTSASVAYAKARQRVHDRKQRFLGRRPHRSFRLTRRRDMRRSLKLPGYLAFTGQVHKVLWGNRKTFIWLIVTYAVLTAAFIGVTSQEVYTQTTQTAQEATEGAVSADWKGVTDAITVLVATVGSISVSTPDTTQQVYIVIIGLLIWLTTIWLLRNVLAGHKVKFRDGLYNAGAPIVSTIIVFLVMVIQLIPMGIAAIGYTAATGTGLLDDGIQAMLFWLAAGFLGLLSFYWIIGTLMGLVVVALPGMYPLRALTIAGDMVTSRRIRLTLRLLWLVLLVIVSWAVIMLPLIMFDTWLKDTWPVIVWLPLVPTALLLLTSLSVVWTAAYIYLLYRKVVDDDALPA